MAPAVARVLDEGVRQRRVTMPDYVDRTGASTTGRAADASCAVGAGSLVGMGASDEVSAIFRSTMLLMAVPDEVRGRMQGIFTVVVTGGPRIGDLYIGILATGIALWAPPVIGGFAIIGLIALLLRTQTTFREYDARHPTP